MSFDTTALPTIVISDQRKEMVEDIGSVIEGSIPIGTYGFFRVKSVDILWNEEAGLYQAQYVIAPDSSKKHLLDIENGET